MNAINAFFRWIQTHQVAIGLIILPVSGAYAAATNYKEEINNFFDPPLASLKITAEADSVDLNNNLVLKAVLHQTGGKVVLPGVVEFSADRKYLKDVENTQVNTEEFKGSIVVTSRTEYRAVASSKEAVQIQASFSSGELYVTSNKLWIKITEPSPAEISPHLDSSDTNRVNLTGTWQLEVGGHQGLMHLKQATDSTLSGTFSIPGSNWPEGKITGFKDGATIRVFFDFDSKLNERVRVAGYFSIDNGSDGYIQIKGCAYHLKRAINTRYTKTGKEGLDCNEPGYYDNWKQLAGVIFYASAPFNSKLKAK